MVSPVFCCDCGDGPYNTAVVIACTRCSHNLCVNCRPSTEYWAHSNAAALSTQQIALYASGHSAHDTNSRNACLHHTAIAPNAGFSENNNSMYSAPYNQHPEYPSNWRWTCCKCGHANSVKVDLGCASCSDHWKGPCCSVWQQ